MTLAKLAAQAPHAYELARWVGIQRRRTRMARAMERGGWFAAGAALGGGLAVLFTPRSGAEMRRRLGSQARRAKDYVAPSDDGAAVSPRTTASRPTAS